MNYRLLYWDKYEENVVMSNMFAAVEPPPSFNWDISLNYNIKNNNIIHEKKGSNDQIDSKKKNQK